MADAPAPVSPKVSELPPLTHVLSDADLKQLKQTVNDLATENIPDKDWLEVFLLTHTYVASPDLIFKMITDRYREAISEDASSRESLMIQMRIVNLLKKWVSLAYNDLFLKHDEVMSLLKAFLDELNAGSGTKWAATIQKTIEICSEVNVRKPDATLESLGIDEALDEEARKACWEKFENMDAATIAQHILRFECLYFRQISPFELMHKAYNVQEQAPIFLAYLEHMQKITVWIASAIVAPSTTKKRASLIVKFLHILKEFHDLNNFSGVAQVLQALTSPAVERLRSTWKLVTTGSGKAANKALLSTLEECKTLFCESGDFANYHATLKVTQLPYIPHSGIYMTEIQIAEDTLPLRTEKELNLEKLRIIGKVLIMLRDSQEVQYTSFDDSALDKEFTHFLLLPYPFFATEAELMNKSYEAEPSLPGQSSPKPNAQRKGFFRRGRSSSNLVKFAEEEKKGAGKSLTRQLMNRSSRSFSETPKPVFMMSVQNTRTRSTSVGGDERDPVIEEALASALKALSRLRDEVGAVVSEHKTAEDGPHFRMLLRSQLQLNKILNTVNVHVVEEEDETEFAEV